MCVSTAGYYCASAQNAAPNATCLAVIARGYVFACLPLMCCLRNRGIMALLVNQLQHARVLATRDITAQLDPLHQLRFVSITRRLLLVVQGTALGAGIAP